MRNINILICLGAVLLLSTSCKFPRHHGHSNHGPTHHHHHNNAPGKSEHAPGHDKAGPGNSENAPGHNKENKHKKAKTMKKDKKTPPGHAK